MLDFFLTYFDFIWNAYKNIMIIGSGMGLFAVVVWILATVLAIAMGIIAPLVLTFGLIAFVLIAGVKIGIFLCFLFLVASITQGINKSTDEVELKSIMKNHPAISIEEAKDIRKAQKEFDSLFPAHKSLWREEMRDRKRALEKKEMGSGQPVETSHASLVGNRWVWKYGRELKDPSKMIRPE